jgi:undecaprenyl-diphosphatase
LTLLDRRVGLIVAANLTFGQLVIQLLKRVVNRPRPYTTHEWVVASKPPKCKYSFPSGHTNSAFSIALTLSLFFPALTGVIVILASAVGVSRIYLGFHYPTDVSVGFLLSFFAFELFKHFLLF